MAVPDVELLETPATKFVAVTPDDIVNVSPLLPRVTVPLSAIGSIFVVLIVPIL
jgi:hypothetical protein